jgi:DNA polymerase III subunit delta
MPKISLFHGDEDFFLNEELKELKKGYSEFNYERINGEKTGADNIISALTTCPLLGGDRLVVVDSYQGDENGDEKLFNVLRGLDNTVKAVFVYYDGPDKRKKFYKFFEKNGEVREFKRFSEWEQDKVLAWIVNRVRSAGKKIGSRAANLLVEISGLNLRMLDKEIEKIATYIGNREMIEEQDVAGLASSGEMDAFALSNALRDKNVREAIKCLTRYFKDGQDPHSLIGMLAKLYRMLLQVKCLEEKGLGQSDIARELRAKPFFIKKCAEKTGRFTVKELSAHIKKLHYADLKMKSGASPRLTMEMLIPELCDG